MAIAPGPGGPGDDTPPPIRDDDFRDGWQFNLPPTPDPAGWWDDPDNPFYDGDGDGIPDSWVIDGPHSYKCLYYSVIFIPSSGEAIYDGLLSTQPGQDAWIGEVYSDANRTEFLFTLSSTEGSTKLTGLLKDWIDLYCDDETVTPPSPFSINLIAQDYKSWRGSYSDCIDVGVALSDMQFVQTTRANLNRTFTTDSTKAEVLVIGPIPEGVKIPVLITIEAIDESFPAGTRNEDYNESHTVYLEDGDSLEIASNGVSISFSIIRDGSEIVDQFSVSNLHSKYTKSGVEVKVGQIQSCTKEVIVTDEECEEGFEMNEEGECVEIQEETEGMDNDTLWTILGFLVLLVLGGWILHTTREGGD